MPAAEVGKEQAERGGAESRQGPPGEWMGIPELSNGTEPKGGGVGGRLRFPALVNGWGDARTCCLEREPRSLRFGPEGVMTLDLGSP